MRDSPRNDSFLADGFSVPSRINDPQVEKFNKLVEPISFLEKRLRQALSSFESNPQMSVSDLTANVNSVR